MPSAGAPTTMHMAPASMTFGVGHPARAPPGAAQAPQQRPAMRPAQVGSPGLGPEVTGESGTFAAMPYVPGQTRPAHYSFSPAPARKVGSASSGLSGAQPGPARVLPSQSQLHNGLLQ